jgi:hypothetical protein
VLLSEDDDVVEAVPLNGPDHALIVRILPGGPWRGEDLLDSRRTHSTNEGRVIDLVSVPDDVLRRRVVRESPSPEGRTFESRAPSSSRWLSQPSPLSWSLLSSQRARSTSLSVARGSSDTRLASHAMWGGITNPTGAQSGTLSRATAH